MVTLRIAVANAPRGAARGARLRYCVALFASLAGLALWGCAIRDSASGAQYGTQRVKPRYVLSPLLTVPGARLARAADGTGTPFPFAEPAPMTLFIHPVATAALGNDLYVADAGAGKVFRYDFALNVMVAVPSAPAALGTRLAVGSDLSLYVLDQPRRRVLRLGRDGQLLATFADETNLNRPIAIAVDDARGRVLVADQLYNHLVAFHPLGGAAEVVHLRGDGRNRVMSIAAIALARDAIHVSDALCRCIVVAARDGTVRSTYGHQQLGQPGGIAIDRHERVVVADVFDGSIKVFVAGQLIDHVPGQALGVREVADLWVSESRLVVADGAGARVAIMRIAPPREE